MNFQPLYDRVLIKRIEQNKISKGGVIIPDTVKEKPMEGTVIAVGNGSREVNGSFKSLSVSKGDRVLFAKWGATEVILNGKEHLVIKESDILGILKR